MLLNILNVDSLQLHHRLNVPLESVQLPQPAAQEQVQVASESESSSLFLRRIQHASKVVRFLPGNLSALPGLLGDLRQLPVAGLIFEQGGAVGGLQAVQGALCQRPLRLPFAPSVILLRGEGRLRWSNSQITHFVVAQLSWGR